MPVTMCLVTLIGMIIGFILKAMFKNTKLEYVGLIVIILSAILFIGSAYYVCKNIYSN